MKTIVAMTLAVFSSACFAQGLYVGGAVGMTSVDVDTGSRADALTAAGIGHTGVSADEQDTGFKAYVGYRLNRNFAVEGGIVDLGEVTTRATVVALGGIPVIPGSIVETISTEMGLHFSGLGILPINDRLDAFAKLGIYSIKVEADLVASGSGGTATIATASDSGTDLLFGAGLQYSFTPNLGGRIEWERFKDVGGDDTGEGDIDMWSVGIVYRF